MSKIAELVTLLKALEKSEKRYITIGVNQLSSNQREGPSHIQLFKALSDSELFKLLEKRQYSRNLTQEQFIKQWSNDHIQDKLLRTNNVQKLLDVILDYLRQYHGDKPEIRLERFIQDIRLYMDKGMKKEALRLIAKAKDEVLHKYENPLKAQEIILLERQVRTMIGSDDMEAIELLHQESLAQNKHTHELFLVIKDRELLLEHLRKKRNEKFEPTKLSDITQRVINDISATEGLAFLVQMHSLFNASLYYHYFHLDEKYTSRLKLAFKYRKKLYELFKESPSRQEMHAKTFNQVRNIYLSGCYHTNNFEEIASLKTELEQMLGFKWEGDQLSIDSRLISESDFNALNLILIHYSQKQQLKQVKMIIEQASPLLLEAPIVTDSRYALLMNFAINSLKLRELEWANQYLEKIEKLDLADKSAYLLVDVLKIMILFRDKNKLDKSLEEKIATLILKLAKGKNTEENSLARKILSTLYSILTQKIEAYGKKTSMDSLQQHELAKLTGLMENIKTNESKTILVANIIYWLDMWIKELQQTPPPNEKS